MVLQLNQQPWPRVTAQSKVQENDVLKMDILKLVGQLLNIDTLALRPPREGGAEF